MKLQGRAALITGASRGLGRTIAAQLIEDGANVVLAARNAPALELAARELLDKRPVATQMVLWQAADVSDESQVANLFAFSASELGRLDVLVCNAGVQGPIGRTEDIAWMDWQRTVQVNLFGVVLCCRAAVPLMRRQGSGKIIGLSGGGATKARARFSAYAAAKTAVVRFLETLAEELAGTGIDVNAVAPGSLNTQMLDEVLAAGPEKAGEDSYRSSRAQAESGGTPLRTAAELVAFLASDESDGITGRILAAVWDDWRHLPEIRARLAGTDVYRLRRILPADRGWE